MARHDAERNETAHDDFDLLGKVAVVTGAARGLGAAFCLRLAAVGARVLATDLRDCAETVQAVRAAGGEAVGHAGSVTVAADAEDMVRAARDAFGRVDVLVNNAAMYGNLHSGRFERLDEDEWDACMDVNVKGLWQCAKAAVPAMREQGGGSIISISSTAAVWGSPYGLHYATSKGAVIGFTRALARELGRDNIRVNAVAPAMTHTPGTMEMAQDRIEQMKDMAIGRQALRKPLETEDIVGTVLYLAGGQSRYVTGQTLMADGGAVFL
jgi:3-oxoacyl-[acyl-carrier protein] reductase